MNKKYLVIDGLTEDDKQKIRESLGDSHGDSIIKHGFYTNTLPHMVLSDDGLMYLFEKV